MDNLNQLDEQNLSENLKQTNDKMDDFSKTSNLEERLFSETSIPNPLPNPQINANEKIEKKKSSKKLIGIILASIVVISALCAVFAFSSSKKKTVREELYNGIVSSMESNSYEKALAKFNELDRKGVNTYRIKVIEKFSEQVKSEIENIKTTASKNISDMTVALDMLNICKDFADQISITEDESEIVSDIDKQIAELEKNKRDLKYICSDYANKGSWCTISEDGATITLEAKYYDYFDMWVNYSDVDDNYMIIAKRLGFNDTLKQRVGNTSGGDGVQIEESEYAKVSFKYYSKHIFYLIFSLK